MPPQLPAKVYAPNEMGYGPGMQYGDVGQPPMRRPTLRNTLAQKRADNAGRQLRNVLSRNGSAWASQLTHAKGSWTTENTNPRAYRGATGAGMPAEGVEETLEQLQDALSDYSASRDHIDRIDELNKEAAVQREARKMTRMADDRRRDIDEYGQPF